MKIKQNTLTINAYHLSESILLKNFRQEFKGKLLGESSSELFYQFEGGHLLIFNYGVAVFAELDPIARTNFIRLLTPYLVQPHQGPQIHEDFTIIQDANLSKPSSTYNELAVPNINSDLLRVSMLQVAQSAALDYYLVEAQKLFDETSGLAQELERTGNIRFSRRALLKFIGRAINTKNRIFDDLYIFDASPVVWEDELLGQVNDGLYRIFDIHNRYREIEYMLKIIEENLHLFIELIDVRKSHRLEWIVIILILFEVIHLIIQSFH